MKPLVDAICLALKGPAAEKEGFWDRDSTEIWRFVELLASGKSPTAVSLEALPNIIAELEPPENRINLKHACKERARNFAAEENWAEYDSITSGECTGCHAKLKLAQVFLVTSCHLYCKDCYKSLPGHDGITGSQGKICQKCKKEITNAANFHPPEAFLLAEAPSTSFMYPGNKRKRATTGKVSTKKAPKTKGAINQNERIDASIGLKGSPIEDWIPFLREYHIGTNWLGSKMTAVRDIVRQWLREDKDNKIAIFTHFVDSQRILEMVCEEENWHYAKVIILRDTVIAFFQC